MVVKLYIFNLQISFHSPFMEVAYWVKYFTPVPKKKSKFLNSLDVELLFLFHDFVLNRIDIIYQ